MSVAIAPGQTIRHYRIVERLGAGGMGVVYKAEDTKLGRTVALKFLPPELTSDDLAKQRFLVEARAASRLDHPNICTVHEVGETESGELYFAMALYEGETLQQRIARGPLAPSAVIDIVAQTARGLAKAHDAGIIHRDIKPANVIVTPDGLVKIVDFGLAKLSQVSLTKSQSFLGTAGYMAPEQLRGEKVTPATDVWALGVMTHEMLTGKNPFPGDYVQAVMYSILNLDPAPIDMEDCPQALVELIRRALTKDPSARLQTAHELLELLTVVESGPSGGVAGARPVRRGRVGWLTIAAVASLVLAAGAWVVRSKMTAVVPQTSGSVVDASQIASAERLTASRQQLISTFAGSHHGASFSPDGKRIVFVDSATPVPQLWILTLGEPEPRQVTFGELAAEHPRWSPTDDRIVFTGRTAADPTHPSARSSSIWIFEPGGEPRKILDQARNPSWSDDGKRLVFERGFEIWTALPDGSAQRRVDGVPSVEALLAERSPAFSPDGSLVAFFHPTVAVSGDIWVVPSAGGQARRLTFDTVIGGTPAWTRDGKHIVFSSHRGGSITLWSVSVTGGKASPLLISPGDDTEPALSPDGRLLIYTSARNAYVIKATDPLKGTHRELYEARAMTFATSLSPDGKRLLLMGPASGGDIRIYSLAIEGGAAREAFPQAGEKNLYGRWSADGESIYFYQLEPEPSFRRVDAGNSTSTSIVSGWTWDQGGSASVDPFGKKLVYTQLDRREPVATMMRDIDSGAENPLPTVLGGARWSQDGSMLAGVAGGEVVICDSEGRECRSIGKGAQPRWSPGSPEVYFMRGRVLTHGFPEIWAARADRRVAPRKIVTLGAMHSIGTFFDVAPGGEIIWTEYREGRSELWLAELSTTD